MQQNIKSRQFYLDFNTYYDTTFERKAGINLDN